MSLGLYSLLALSLLLWLRTRSLGAAFFDRLETRYPDAFEGIPKPARGMVQYGPLTKAQMGYIGKRGYKVLGDDELERMGDRVRILQRAYVASFVITVIAFALRLALTDR
jgi:hypothetical protein